MGLAANEMRVCHKLVRMHCQIDFVGMQNKYNYFLTIGYDWVFEET